MRGGNAKKHLIYFQARTGEWWFDESCTSSVDEAWQAVHQGFLDAIALGGGREVEWRSSRLPGPPSAPALVNKTLSVYFPDELLPINSRDAPPALPQRLGEPQARRRDARDDDSNRLLLEDLRACSELDGWTTKQMERLLYSQTSIRSWQC